MIKSIKKPLLIGGGLSVSIAALAAVSAGHGGELLLLVTACASAVLIAKLAKSGISVGETTGLIQVESKPDATPAVIESLELLGVRGCELVRTEHGKVIDRHIIKPPRGKLPKIYNTDLARNLGAKSVIIDPNIGSGLMAVEVPAAQRQTVDFKTCLRSNAWQESAKKMAIPMLLGEDVGGKLVAFDIATAPHLLVAGQTGGGKSGLINSMILSIMQSTSDVRLLLIDPKIVEFALYQKSNKLYAPVITDMQQAATALTDLIDVMERRYQTFAAAGCKNIAHYNSKSDDKMPYIVVIVDEFADMMMAVGDEIETLIARLAQKARAAGIHLILATQRPSVDVITGLIKANIHPYRAQMRIGY